MEYGWGCIRRGGLDCSRFHRHAGTRPCPHPLVAAVGIGPRVLEHVADVQARGRRLRELDQVVKHVAGRDGVEVDGAAYALGHFWDDATGRFWAGT